MQPLRRRRWRRARSVPDYEGQVRRCAGWKLPGRQLQHANGHECVPFSPFISCSVTADGRLTSLNPFCRVLQGYHCGQRRRPLAVHRNVQRMAEGHDLRSSSPFTLFSLLLESDYPRDCLFANRARPRRLPTRAAAGARTTSTTCTSS